jgi:hypothetical protein
MQDNSSVEAAVGIVGLLFILLIAGIVIILVMAIWGTIFKKAGYSFWMCLLMLVPLVNLIWLLIFAFSTWPIHRELEALRQGRPVGAPGFPMPTATMR